MTRVFVVLLVLNIVATFAVWWQLLTLRSEVTTVVKGVDTTIRVLDGLRVSVSGSLVEKAKLLKNSYATAADGIRSLFKRE